MRNYTIGIQGSKTRINLVRKMIKRYYPELNIKEVEDESYIYREDTAKKLEAMKEYIDGMLFDNEIHHDIYQHIFKDSFPCMYIPRDYSAFMTCLLRFSQKGINLSRIAMDHISVAWLKPMYEEFGISMDGIHLLSTKSSLTVSETYFEELVSRYKQLYGEKKVDGVITYISVVKEELEKVDIPVLLLTPTPDTVIRAIQRMVLNITSDNEKKSKSIAVIMIHLKIRDELALRNNADYLESREKLLAAEEIHHFARNAKAAVLTQSDELFTIFIDTEELMYYSQLLSVLPLLQHIWDNTDCDFSVGIGLGRNPSDAKLNASVALKRAEQVKSAGVFLGHSPVEIEGPFQFVDCEYEKTVKAQNRIHEIAMKTGVSEDRISILMELLEGTGQDLVVAKDLCDKLNISSRAANRLLSTLEEYSYAVVVSRVKLGKAGRPSNVYKLVF